MSYKSLRRKIEAAVNHVRGPKPANVDAAPKPEWIYGPTAASIDELLDELDGMRNLHPRDVSMTRLTEISKAVKTHQAQ